MGAVKRRLAAGIGAAAALGFYRRTTGVLLRRLSRDPRWHTVLALTPDRAAARRCVWQGSFTRCGQGSGDLGGRMERAMRRFPASPVVLVGSDIPDIRSFHVAEAFRALGRNEFVFGPSDDGGYWLAGARHGALASGLFRNVRWSGPHALSDTLVNAEGSGVAFLQELCDIDTVDDLLRWRGSRSHFS